MLEQSKQTLQQAGYEYYDLTINDYKKIAAQQRETFFFQTQAMTYQTTSPTVAQGNIIGGTTYVAADTTVKLQYSAQFIDSVIDMDPIIEFVSLVRGATLKLNSNIFGNIPKISLTSRASNNLIPQSTQDRLQWCPLATFMRDRDNLNIVSNLNGSVFSNNCAFSRAEEAKAGEEKYFRFRLSEFYGGKDGIFSKKLYVGNDQIQLSLWLKGGLAENTAASQTLVNQWFSVAAGTTVPQDQSAFRFSINNIYFNYYKIPGTLQKQLLAAKLFTDYSLCYQIPSADVSGSGTTNLQYNIYVNQSQFQGQFEGLAIFFDNSNYGANDMTNPTTALNANFGSTGVPLMSNAASTITSLQITNGANIILQLDSQAKVQNYFLQQQDLLPVQNIPQFYGVWLSKDICSQYSNQVMTVFTVKATFSGNYTNYTANYIFGRGLLIIQGGQLQTIDALSQQVLSQRNM